MPSIDPDFRCVTEPSAAELVRIAIDRRDWQWAANMCRAGMALKLDNEEAVFLAAWLPDVLRLDAGEAGTWYVLAEGTVSW